MSMRSGAKYYGIRSFRNKALFIFLGVMLMVLPPFGASKALSAPTVYNWKFHTFLPPPDDIYLHSLPHLVKMIEDATKGQVKLTLYAGGTIVKGPDLLASCRDGVIEMAYADPGYWRGTIPISAVEGGLPFSYQDRWEALSLLEDYGLAELLRKEYAKHNVHLLGHNNCAGGGHGILTKKPVNTLADLKRMKIRSFGPNLELLDKMGAVAMSIPLAETYLALATGTVEGCHTAWNPMYNSKFYEVCKYGMFPSTIGDSIHHILVNMDAWKTLPDDLKTIITLTHRNWSFWHARLYTPIYDIIRLKDLEEKGVKFTTLPMADQAKILEIAMGMWDKLGAGDRVAGEGVKILKDYYKKIGRTR